MAVLITWKSDKDLIKNDIAILRPTFSEVYDAPQGWATLMPIFKSKPKLNWSRTLSLSCYLQV